MYMYVYTVYKVTVSSVLKTLEDGDRRDIISQSQRGTKLFWDLSAKYGNWMANVAAFFFSLVIIYINCSFKRKGAHLHLSGLVPQIQQTLCKVRRERRTSQTINQSFGDNLSIYINLITQSNIKINKSFAPYYLSYRLK